MTPFEDKELDSILLFGRNSRVPNRANHGARPCSSYMRRLKIKGYYKSLKEEMAQDEDDPNVQDMDGFEEEREMENKLKGEGKREDDAE